jgi:hypothetical protein
VLQGTTMRKSLLNDIEARIANGLKFPIADFVCIYCDENSETGND